jgi:GntR family transcriptional repressor for pyruvate dehydrogenase complex
LTTPAPRSTAADIARPATRSHVLTIVPLHAIESRRLYRQIADQVRALVHGGEFPPGSRLPAERELAQQLGVSRPSVREALIALEVEGLVEVRVGSGVHVLEAAPRGRPSRSVGDASGPFEIIRARQVIEGELAAIAARRMGRAQVARLREVLQAMADEIAAGSMPIHSDRRFHLVVAEAAANAPLLRAVTSLYDERNNPLFERLGRHFENSRHLALAMAEHEQPWSRPSPHRDPARPGCDAAATCSARRTALHAMALRARRSRPRRPCPTLAAGPHDLACTHPRRARPAPAGGDAAREPGPHDVLLGLGAGGICGSDLHYFQQGRVGAFVDARAAGPRARSLGRGRAHRRAVTRVQAGRPRRHQPQPPLRALRLLPRRPRQPVPAHVLPGQRQRVPARAQGMFRERFVMGEAQLTPITSPTSRWARSPAPSRCRSACTRCTAPVGGAGRDRAGHRRRHHRLHVRAGGTPGRRGARHRLRHRTTARWRMARTVGADEAIRSDQVAPESLAGMADVAIEAAGSPGALATCLRPPAAAAASCRSARCRRSCPSRSRPTA